MNETPELTNDEWAEYLERLTHYADNKFLVYGWMGSSKKNERIGPRAISPQDLAAEAILSVIQKKRRYNKETYHDFMTFLQSIVDSKINILSNLVEHKIKKPLLQETYEQADKPISGNKQEPSRICISKELVEKLKASLASDFNKDKLIRGLFECMEGGITKRRDIAQLLDVRVKEIDNARKRLYRRIREINRL